MKTDNLLAVAAAAAAVLALNPDALARGGGVGGMGFHSGGSMAFHGGGGFVRSAPSFGSSSAAFRGGSFAAPRFSSGQFTAPRTTFVQPGVVTGRRFSNAGFVSGGEFWRHHDHDHHRHFRNVVIVNSVPYYTSYNYPYYADTYSDYYPSDYYYSDTYPSAAYTEAPSTYSTSYATTPVTFAVGGSSSVVVLQRRLAREGFYHGRIDGVMGPETRAAIQRSERAHGRTATVTKHHEHARVSAHRSR